jgi:predicted metalloprotease with PDZ domain
MEYRIYRKSIPSQFIQIKLILQCKKDERVELQLPSWRPGRYELANYSQRLRDVKAEHNGQQVYITKATKDLWHFIAPQPGPYIIEYEYYAAQMDAGGSWSDDEQLYLNFINFIFQVKGREEEATKVQLDLPPDFQIATALPLTGAFLLEATGFQHLVDSPLIASPSLIHHQYQIGHCTFHLWFQGRICFDIEELKNHFIKFTEKQIAAFGDFPSSNYYFLFQLLPYKHYHGVEHQFSTVITLGPAEELATAAAMDQLIGVSSHELYHFWNVCRIRPKALLPYDFSKEAYIDSGVVAEGVTTYMGDLFLFKSGYLSLDGYLSKLEKMINREFEQFGWKNMSIAESSFDLWLDGYKPGIPNRKVSIYNRGALICLCLELILLDCGSSLSAVMKMMWTFFGKKNIGYSLHDFQRLIAQALNDPTAAEQFFREYIYGKKDLLPLLKEQFESLGIILSENKKSRLESDFGLKLDDEGVVQSVHPESEAYEKIMIGDLVTDHEFSFNGRGERLNITLIRRGRRLTIQLDSTDNIYYKNYTLQLDRPSEKIERWKQ